MSEREVIRRSQPADIPLLAALFREAFGTDRPEAMWRWKYFAARPSVGYVCEADGRLVAHCGGIPVRFRDGTREYLAYQSVDFMSSPLYAGGSGAGGVFVRTARRMFEECCGPSAAPLVYGFPGERHRIVGEKLLGYRPLEPVVELTLNADRASLQARPLHSSSLSVFTRFEARFGAIRDHSYLRWRYMEHPVHRYSVVEVRRRLRAETAALLRELDEHFLIMELGGKVNATSIERLLGTLTRLGKPVKAWCSPKHPIGVLLVNNGFTATPRDHWLEYRFFVDRSEPAVGELYYTAGDYDVF